MIQGDFRFYGQEEHKIVQWWREYSLGVAPFRGENVPL